MKRSKEIAKEISKTLPTFLRHMYPYVFQPLDIPPTQILIITVIEEKGTCTMGELKDEMHVSAPTITGIISRMEASGYVKRLVHPKDRRIINVRLTKRGLGVAAKFRYNIQKRWEYVIEKLPSRFGETHLKIMSTITKGFNDGTI